jgi:hypothetical protein
MDVTFEPSDYTPMEGGKNLYYYNLNDLDDAKSSVKSFYDASNYSNRLNIFKGMSTFQAVCLSPPIVGRIVDNLRTNDSNSNGFIMLKAHIPELHSQIGNPCDILDTKLAMEQKKILITNSIKNHPWFVGDVLISNNSITKLPSFGDIVRVKFQKNPSGGSMLYGVYKGIIRSSPSNSIEAECKENIIETFNSLPIATLGKS